MLYRLSYVGILDICFVPNALRFIAKVAMNCGVFAQGKSKRAMGIEPTLSAWKAEVLPLNYTRTPYFSLRSWERPSLTHLGRKVP